MATETLPLPLLSQGVSPIQPLRTPILYPGFHGDRCCKCVSKTKVDMAVVVVREDFLGGGKVLQNPV